MALGGSVCGGACTFQSTITLPYDALASSKLIVDSTIFFDCKLTNVYASRSHKVIEGSNEELVSCRGIILLRLQHTSPIHRFENQPRQSLSLCCFDIGCNQILIDLHDLLA